jgi:hypothetical protein
MKEKFMNNAKKPEKMIEDNCNALLETSSIIAHDISGQLHLLNFCAEELAEELGKGNKFLDRMVLGLDNLNEMVLNYRAFLKENKFNNNRFKLSDIIKRSIDLLRIHQWNDREALNISLEEDSQSEITQELGTDLVQITFAILSFINDEYKRKEVENKNVKISFIKFDSTSVEFKILCRNLKSSKEEFTNYCDQDQPGLKMLRIGLGKECLFNNEYEFNSEQTTEGCLFYIKYQY